MPNARTAPDPREARALRRDLLDADDQKIRRIIAVVEGAADPRVNQALLDPLRTRLAVLRPVRPLRFARLLFIPLDPLIVPPRDWRPGDPTVPRNVLAAMDRVVRAALGGGEVARMEALIEGLKTDAALVITRVGETLWPRAGDILATAPMPPDWAETGARPAAWPVLAKAIATVLRRAPRLRALAHDAAVGAVALDEMAVNALLRDIAHEPPEGCAMLARLILACAPHAAPLLRHLIDASQSPVEKAMMRQAVATGMDQVLTGMEQSDGFLEEIGHGGLADATAEIRRMAIFLREIEQDTTAAKHRPRLKAIRDKLDQACRARFTAGINEELIGPLAEAAVPLDKADQTRMETRARDLRALETVARKVGGPAVYDQHLNRASDAVREAAKTGTLTPVRQIRLIEILSGPEAAEALYHQQIQGREIQGQQTQGRETRAR